MLSVVLKYVVVSAEIIILLIAYRPVFSQEQGGKSIGCDLKYESILVKNNLSDIPWIKRWFATYNKPPAPLWIANWKSDPIISYVLIEYPAFHAAERSTLWLVRTKSQAFYWESVQSDYHSIEEIEKRTQRHEIKLATYDEFFNKASAWKQAGVLKPKLPIDGFSPEFWGVASIFDGNACRQLLLGVDDFMSCTTKECKKPLESGKVMSALSPILLK